MTAETNQQNHHIEEQGCNREIGTSVLKFIIGEHHCLVLGGSKFGREQRDITVFINLVSNIQIETKLINWNSL